MHENLRVSVLSTPPPPRLRNNQSKDYSNFSHMHNNYNNCIGSPLDSLASTGESTVQLTDEYRAPLEGGRSVKAEQKNKLYFREAFNRIVGQP